MHIALKFARRSTISFARPRRLECGDLLEYAGGPHAARAHYEHGARYTGGSSSSRSVRAGDSWDHDALVRDALLGRYGDPANCHVLNPGGIISRCAARAVWRGRRMPSGAVSGRIIEVGREVAKAASPRRLHRHSHSSPARRISRRPSMTAWAKYRRPPEALKSCWGAQRDRRPHRKEAEKSHRFLVKIEISSRCRTRTALEASVGRVRPVGYDIEWARCRKSRSITAGFSGPTRCPMCSAGSSEEKLTIRQLLLTVSPGRAGQRR